jgi:hypothetical protein
MDGERQYAVVSILTDYVRSPSLRHLRDPHSLQKVAKEIVRAIDRASSVWAKWDGPREQIARSAAPCWIPMGDLLAFLNRLPGPALTRTDVAQRLQAIYEEPYEHFPNDDVKDGCLALYEAEKAQGTEMPAIIGAIQEFIEVEEDRLSREREENHRRHEQEEKARLHERFMAGADSGWMCPSIKNCYRVVLNDLRFEITDNSTAIATLSQHRRSQEHYRRLSNRSKVCILPATPVFLIKLRPRSRRGPYG